MDSKYVVTPQLLDLGEKVYEEIEKRDSMYKVSIFLIEHFKQNPFSGDVWITDAILVLLLTWHNAFYRYALPERFHDNLKEFWEINAKTIFKTTLSEEEAKLLFEELLDKLKIKVKNTNGKEEERESGVAVVKVLHLLNPDVFPLWDGYIANAYLRKSPNAKFPPPRRASDKLKEFEEYWKFKLIIDKQCEFLRERYQCFKDEPNSVLYKRLDELNYVLFTLNQEQVSKAIKEHFPQLAIKAKEELKGEIGENSFNIYLKALDVITS
jgi:hypothetical protein